MGERLRHLPQYKPHDLERDGFELEQFLAELRTIVAQAIHRCGVSEEVLFGDPVKFRIAGDEMQQPPTAEANQNNPVDRKEERRLWSEFVNQLDKELASIGELLEQSELIGVANPPR